MATITPGGPTDNEKVITVMAEDLSIEGTITFKSSLRVEGNVKGEIISEGLLVIAPTAKIVASIKTKRLISEGSTEGDVTATEQVVLKKDSVHIGSITTPNIVVESGSTLNGPITMVRDKAQAAAMESAAVAEPPGYEFRAVETPEQIAPAAVQYTEQKDPEPAMETATEPEPEPEKPKQSKKLFFF